MTALNHIPLPIERLVSLEQRMEYFERQHHTMAAKVDEMHAIMLKAQGAKWAIAVLWLAIFSSGGLTAWIATHFHLR